MSPLQRDRIESVMGFMGLVGRPAGDTPEPPPTPSWWAGAESRLQGIEGVQSVLMTGVTSDGTIEFRLRTARSTRPAQVTSAVDKIVIDELQSGHRLGFRGLQS